MVQAIVNDLRDRIFTAELSPGTSLREVELAAHYEVARPTAKAALENLVATGLLTRNAHQTARVRRLTSEDVIDIYRTRAILETEAVRILAATCHAPSAASVANDEITALQDATPIQIVEPDIQFHRALIDALDSPRVRTFYEQLTDDIRLCMAQVQDAILLSTERIATEHRRLLDLIAAGDADSAVEHLERHLDNAGHRLAEHLVRDVLE
ncbi:GntR family transcriptional regulator [Yaniella flava]|uniref:GntR family transcriptional regulator n=1 Tax=Yaniella flava TaxID=287930 RepID=A0ABN2UFB8_9MICC